MLTCCNLKQDGKRNFRFSSFSLSSKVWRLSVVMWSRIYQHFEWKPRNVSNTSSYLWKFLHEPISILEYTEAASLKLKYVIQFSKLNSLGKMTRDFEWHCLIEFAADSGKAIYLFTYLMQLFHQRTPLNTR